MTDAAEQRLNSAWYLVGVLMLAQTCSFIDRMIMGLMVGPIRQSFGISDTQFSLLAGLAFSLFYSLMGLPLARIADRGNRRKLIMICISLWSVMTALCGFAKGFWTLFLARVGVGVGEAALSPAAYSMITDAFPKKTLGLATSVYTMGVTFGSGLAYMLGGAVIGWASSIGSISLPGLGALEGWRLTFMIVGIPGLLVALLLATVKEPPRPAGQTSEAIPLGQVFRFVSERRRAMGCHIIGVAIFIMVVFGINIWGPTYLIRTFGFSPADAGLSFGTIMMVLGTAGLLAGGAIADAWFARGRKNAYSTVILISGLCMLPFVLGLGWATEANLGLICLGGATFFSAFQGGIAAGTLQLMTPGPMRAQVAALYFLLANLIGIGLGPTVVALLTDFVFADDAAIGKSLALSAALLIPVASALIWAGLPAIGEAIQRNMAEEIAS
jgi:MFS family permease